MYWQDIEHGGTRVNSATVNIKTIPNKNKNEVSNVSISINVRSQEVNMDYFLNQQLVNSYAEMKDGGYTIATWGWEECAQDLPQLTNWLEEELK
jgi:hypothetical protein